MGGNLRSTPANGGRPPLAGVRVVEFGQCASAPLAGMLLADQGAQVVKVEPPGGDPARGVPAFHVWNRGKRSAVLDPSDLSGRDSAVSLARYADVLIENQPVLMSRLGLAPADALRINPSLIYCSIPSFPKQKGESVLPGEETDSAWETLANARSGLMYGATYGASPAPPLIASCYAAMLASTDITAALLQRETTSVGQHIEVSLFAAALNAFGNRALSLADPGAQNSWLLPKLPMVEIYRCSDGEFLQNSGSEAPFVSALLTVAERAEWIDEAVAGLFGLPDAASEQGWRERFAAFFSERPADWWEREVNAAGGACTRCRRVEEWWSESHPHEAGLLQKVVDDELGETVQSGPSVRLDSTPVNQPRPGAPTLGSSDLADTVNEFEREWRAQRRSAAEAGTSVGRMSGPAMPLEGIRVIDLCIILAGPTCGRTLADLGAEVIKVESLDRPIRDPYGYLDVNRGKRSIRLNLKTEAGREILWRLIDSADVIAENFRRGKIEKLGFGLAEVRQRKPSIVYASMNAFDYGGPWSDRAGWEYNAQAASGLQMYEDFPRRANFPVNDYGTGLLAAFGAVMALRAVRQGYPPSVIHGSLARTASMLQSHNLANSSGEILRSDWSQVPSEWQQYATSDGKICVRNVDVERISGRLGAEADSDGQLADVLITLTTAEVAAACDAIDVPIELVRSAADVPEVAGPLLRSWIHDSLGEIRQVVSGGTFSGSPPLKSWPAPLPGADYEQILNSLGYDSNATHKLIADGVVGLPIDLFQADRRG
jgi:crotonobetainyl-CoA:carnitine CoA-transferase CaiB-like acyl-CoA transferase